MHEGKTIIVSEQNWTGPQSRESRGGGRGHHVIGAREGRGGGDGTRELILEGEGAEGIIAHTS